MTKSESLLVPMYHNSKAYKGVEVNFFALLTIALEAPVCLSSSPECTVAVAHMVAKKKSWELNRNDTGAHR
jgi:lauroyl/myristoyl acyltransferase